MSERIEQHVWRFELNEEIDSISISSNPLEELIRSNIEEILRIVTLTCQSKAVVIDGFRFHDNDNDYQIYID